MTEDEQLDFNALLFPGRKVLYVAEVAERLEISQRHVLDLIEEGKIGAIDVGGGIRKHWRIPVGEFEKFMKRRSSLGPAADRKVVA